MSLHCLMHACVVACFTTVSCALAGSMGKKNQKKKGGAAAQDDGKAEDSSWVEKSYGWFQEVAWRPPQTPAKDAPEGAYVVSAEDEGKRFESQEQRRVAQANSRLSMNTLVSGFEPNRHTMFVAGRPVQAGFQFHMVVNVMFTVCHV